MDSLLDLLFYVLGGISCFYTIYGTKIPFSSFTGIYLRLTLLLIYLPAYYVYRGGVLYNNQEVIDTFVYLMLLVQILFSCLAAWFAWGVRVNIKLKFASRGNQAIIYSVVLLSAVIYTVAYFYHYYELIPIFKIASGDFLSVAATLRSDLTHGFKDSSIFAYYRPITKDLLFLLMFTLISYDKTIFINKFILTLILSFVLLAHLEKAYLLVLFLAITMLKVINDKVSLAGELYIAIAATIIAAFVTYLFFANSIGEAIEYIPFRLMAQVGYVPEQLQLSKPDVPLLLQGVNLGGLGRLFDIKFIDISKITFESVHPDLVMLGISGSSAGLAISDAYMIFGAIGIPLLFIMLLFHFYIDRLFRISFLTSKVSGLSRVLLISFYIYFITFYPLYLIGSFFGIFSIPYIFQQGIIIAAFIVFLMFRVTLATKRNA